MGWVGGGRDDGEGCPERALWMLCLPCCEGWCVG